MKHLHYKDKIVKVVGANNRCLHTHCVGKMQNVSSLGALTLDVNKDGDSDMI